MEFYVVVGTVLSAGGRYSEFWIEGYTKDEDRAERYAARMNQVHDQDNDETESVSYTVMPVYELESSLYSLEERGFDFDA